MNKNDNVFFNEYGYGSNEYLYTLPEERRDWRKHIENFIDEKVDKAVDDINQNTDDDKEEIVTKVETTAQSVVSQVNAHSDENKTSMLNTIQSWLRI